MVTPGRPPGGARSRRLLRRLASPRVLSQRAALWAQQRMLKDFPMLLFSAVVAPGGALLEFPHNGFVDVSDHKLRHSRTTPRMLAMLASRDQVGNRALTAVVTIGPIDGGFAPWGLPNARYAAPPSRHTARMPVHTAMAAAFASPTRNVVLGRGLQRRLERRAALAGARSLCRPLRREVIVSGWEGEQRQWA